MLVDEVDIKLTAGHGGPGKASFFPGERSGPDGGNGGKGGDIYLTVTSDLTILNRFTREKYLYAQNGGGGGNFRKSGKDGQDMEIKLPIGTEVTDLESGEVWELNDINQRILIAKGGKGGLGTYDLKSSRRTTPKYAQRGLPGQVKKLKLDLKLIADYGLIGLPNAGKSSLLNELTSANVKVADYPFTTLEPSLGVLQNTTGTKIIADIPGLIEGASTGKGLGIKFLKHIERVKLLLHCLAADSNNVVGDYITVREELETFSLVLTQKEEIILLTKTDLIDPKDLKQKLTALKKFKRKVVPVSIHDWDSLQNLSKLLSDTL